MRLSILERAHHVGVETYTFHHALLRDAAYTSLRRERRRDLHDRIARALPLTDPEGVAHYPEMLASHLSEAGHIVEATRIGSPLRARALARSAQTEATQLLQRALADLEKVPQDERTRQLRVSQRPARSGLDRPERSKRGGNAGTLSAALMSFASSCRRTPHTSRSTGAGGAVPVQPRTLRDTARASTTVGTIQSCCSRRTIARGPCSSSGEPFTTAARTCRKD